MKKTTLYLIGAVILLAALLFLSLKRISTLKEDRNRLEQNQEVLFADLEQYKINDSLNAVTVQRLQLTTKEFKETNAELAEKVKAANVKIKDLQTVTDTKINTEITDNFQFKDSIVYIEKERIDTVRCLNIDTKYLYIDICDNDLMDGKIIVPNRLTQIVHPVYKKFLFFRLGIKRIDQEIFSDNPYTKIEYSRYLEIK